MNTLRLQIIALINVLMEEVEVGYYGTPPPSFPPSLPNVLLPSSSPFSAGSGRHPFDVGAKRIEEWPTNLNLVP